MIEIRLTAVPRPAEAGTSHDVERDAALQMFRLNRDARAEADTTHPLLLTDADHASVAAGNHRSELAGEIGRACTKDSRADPP